VRFFVRRFTATVDFAIVDGADSLRLMTEYQQRVTTKASAFLRDEPNARRCEGGATFRTVPRSRCRSGERARTRLLNATPAINIDTAVHDAASHW
jgi:hypothetical protein